MRDLFDFAWHALPACSGRYHTERPIDGEFGEFLRLLGLATYHIPHNSIGVQMRGAL